MTLGIFVAAYTLAFIPASMHIASRQNDIRSRLRALEAKREPKEAHALAELGCVAFKASKYGKPLDVPGFERFAKMRVAAG